MYVAILGSLEVISDLYNSVAGIWLHALLLGWLLYRGSLLFHAPHGKFYLALCVTPLIRLVGYAISSAVFPGVWFYCLTETIVLLSAALAARTVGLTFQDIGFCRPRKLWPVPLVVFSGLAAGWMEAHLIRPQPLTPGLRWPQVWLPALLLMAFTGFGEEIVFRGILQRLADRLYRPVVSVLLVSCCWSILHIVWLSWPDLFLVLGTGLFWGGMRQYSRSVIPLGLAHGLANIALFIVLPYR
jgi:membrane protease YdiL (CAAX protease family)